MSVWREPLYWNGLITGTLFWCVVWLLALVLSWWHDRRKARKVYGTIDSRPTVQKRSRPRRAAKRQTLRGWWRDRFVVDFEPESVPEPVREPVGDGVTDDTLAIRRYGLPSTMSRTRWFAIDDDTVEQEPIR